MYTKHARMAATSGSPTMAQIETISEELRLEALALCDVAGQQSDKMTDYAKEHKKLEMMLIEEAKLIKEHGQNGEYDMVMKKLKESMPACTYELNVLHVKLIALLENQDTISKRGADVAGKLTKNMETSTKAINKANDQKTKAIDKSHKTAMKEQDTKHATLITAQQTKHDEARQKDTAAHKDATTKLTSDHAAANSAKVVVNTLFLQQVHDFVDCVEKLMQDHNNYAQIFIKMEQAIKKINADLTVFDAHTDAAKNAAPATAASVVAGGKKNKPGV